MRILQPEEEPCLWADLISFTVFWLRLIKVLYGSQKLMNLVVKQVFLDNYSMFHVTWITSKFNRNHLGTVSAYII